MGFQIAELYAELGVKDAKFMAGMKRAEQYALRLKTGLASIGRVGKRVFLGLAAAATGALYAFAKQEEAERLLDATLRTTGNSVEKYGLRLREAASAMQSVTTYGDEFVLSLMAQGMNLGVTAGKIEQVTRDSIGLATALKMDLGTAMRYVALAQMGEMTMLRRYIPELRATTDVTKQLAIVNAKAAAGWEQAKEEAKTFGGSLKQIKNMLGDVAETLGRGLLPHIVKFRDELKRLLPAFVSWVKEKREVIAQAGIFIGKLALLAIAIPKAITLIMGLAAAFQMLGAAIGAVAAAKTGAMVGGPIGALVGIAAGIGVAIWGFKKLTSEYQKFRAELEKRVTLDIVIPRDVGPGAQLADIRRQRASRSEQRKALQQRKLELEYELDPSVLRPGPPHPVGAGTQKTKHQARENLEWMAARDRAMKASRVELTKVIQEIETLTTTLTVLRNEARKIERQAGGGSSVFQRVFGPIMQAAQAAGGGNFSWPPRGIVAPKERGGIEKPEREGPQFLDARALWRTLQESVYKQARVEDEIAKNTKDSAESLDEIANELPNLRPQPVTS